MYHDGLGSSEQTRLLTATAAAQVLAAKAVCFGCAVRAACLSYALATGQAGIWGGTTQEERHVIRRSSGSAARQDSGRPGTTRAATDRHNYHAGQCPA